LSPSKKNVTDAHQIIRDATDVDNDPLADINWQVENSKRLVETADRLGLDTSRFDNLRFLVLGSKLAPLLWTIFDTDHQSGDSRIGKTSWDVVCRARSVQRALRSTLRQGSPETTLLLAVRPRDWTDNDVFEAQRADVFCFSTDLFAKYDTRHLVFPHRAAELQNLDIGADRIATLNADFQNEPLCCTRGGLCWWVRQRMLQHQVGERLQLFTDV
jgi:hypothetical protein